MRECGDCQACCTICDVEELQKPAGVGCNFCAAKGCAIYKKPEMPQSCRSFECFWLSNEHEMAESMRPDKCGVMFETLTPNTLLAYVTKQAWNNDAVAAQFQKFVSGGTSVVLKNGEQRHLFVPVGESPQGVWNRVLQEAASRGIS